MKIAIIGTGNVGGALAQSFIRAQHQVIMGAQFPLSEKSKKLMTLLGSSCFRTVDEAIEQAEVIVLTTPPDVVTKIFNRQHQLNGKIIIDATNSIRVKPEPFPTAYHAIKSMTNSEAVVKCFNTTGFENLLNPMYRSEGIDMFCAGDHQPSKLIAAQLSKEIGFNQCIDFGGDDKVVLLEQFALCWINLAIMQGNGRDIAFKMIKR
jgi:predicted dinucleotide-binding enzyme